MSRRSRLSGITDPEEIISRSRRRRQLRRQQQQGRPARRRSHHAGDPLPGSSVPSESAMDYQTMLKHLLAVSKDIHTNEEYLLKLAELTNETEQLRSESSMYRYKLRQMEKERNSQYERAESLNALSNQHKIELEEIYDQLRDRKTIYRNLKKLESDKVALLQYSHTVAEEKSKLEVELDSAQERVNQLQSVVGELRGEDTGRKEVVADMEGELQKLRHAVSERDEIIGSLQKEASQHEAAILRERTKFEEVEMVQEELLVAIREIKGEKDELADQKIKLENELEKQAVENERRELLITTLQREMKHQTISSDEGRMAVDSVRRIKDEQIETLEKEKRVLVGEKAELESQLVNLERSSRDANASVVQYEQMVANLTRQLEEVKKNHETLVSGVQEASSGERQARIDLDALREENEALKGEITSLRDATAVEKDSLLRDKSRIVDLEQLLREKTEALDQLSTQQEEESELLHEKIETLQQRLRQHGQGLRASSLREDENDRLRLEVEGLKAQVAEISATRDAVQRTCDLLREQITTSTTAMESTQKTREYLEMKITERDQEIARLSTNGRTLTGHLEEKVREVQMIKLDFQKLKSRYTDRREKLQQIVKLNENYSLVNKKLKREIRAKNRMIRELQEGLEQSKHQSTDVDRLRQELRSCHEVITVLRGTNRKLEGQLQKDSSLLQSCQDKISQLEYDRSMEKRVMDSEIGHLRGVNEQLNQKIKSITSHNLSILSNVKLDV